MSTARSIIIFHAIPPQKYSLLQFHTNSRWSIQSLRTGTPNATQYRNDIDNKRSKLFPDRKRIPGRKTKYILAIVYLIHIYAVTKFLQQKRLYSYTDNNPATRQSNRDTCRERPHHFSSHWKIFNTPLWNIVRISSSSRLSKAKEALNICKNSIVSPTVTSSCPAALVEHGQTGKKQEQDVMWSHSPLTLMVVTSQATTSKTHEISIQSIALFHFKWNRIILNGIKLS